jgi:drug/metabolite transporter (DMT)-like permease
MLVVPLALRSPSWRSAPFQRLFVIGLLLQGVQFAGIYGGLALGVPAGLSALVVLGLAPIATTALATLAGMESPDRRTWVALAVGIFGVTVSVLPELDHAQVTAGLGLTVAGMIGLAAGTVLQKRWAATVDATVSVAVQSTAAALVIIPLATLVTRPAWHLDLRLVLSELWLGWPLSVGTMMLFAWLLNRRDASIVSALLLLVPATTAAMAALVLGERLVALSVVGMAITIPAVATVVRVRPAVRRER